MSNGARTRDIGHHKAALYQLSYTHHVPSQATPTVYYSPAANDETAAAAAPRAVSLVGPGCGTNTASR